ncbi:MAG: hypothetical protein ACXABY_37315, partial [Candidatus Thorarchaeota archaeon]
MTVPEYQSFAEAKVASPDNDITISKPAGVVNGDLMVAVIAIDSQASDILKPPGWTAIQLLEGGAVTLLTYYKVASSEGASYKWFWSLSNDEEAYGFIMRITGHDSTTPVNTSAIDSGTSASPTCPTVTPDKEDCLLLRIFAADDDDITVDGGYPSGYTGITVDESSVGTGTCSGGAAWKNHASPIATGTAAFTLTSSEQWVGVTIAINSPEGPSASISSTPSASVSASISATSSVSASVSSSSSASVSASISSTPSASLSSSPSASISASVSSSPSASISSTPSASV